MKPYLVVLGGNKLAVPALKQLRELGYRVLVVDGNPAAPGFEVAERSIVQNFTEVASTVEKLKDIEIQGVIPLNDFAIASACALTSARGLPGWNERAKRCFTDKSFQKQVWVEAGLRTARYESFPLDELLAGKIGSWRIFPCIVKPSFSGGGSRGVFLARAAQEIADGLAAQKSFYLDRVGLLEEFIEGSEHTSEVLVSKGRPRLLTISDKANYSGNVSVVQKLFFPGPRGSKFRQKIEEGLYAACKAMQATDGTVHFEYIIRGEDVFLLEAGGRPGGGLNFAPICETAFGYPYPKLLAQVLTGGEPEYEMAQAQHLVWWYFDPGRGGILKEVTGFDEASRDPMVLDADLGEKIGAPRPLCENDLKRPGYLLVRGRSHEQALDKARDLVGRVHFKEG